MGLTDENMVMPVAPYYGGNGGNCGSGMGWGGDWFAWIIILLIFGWGNNGWGNNAGFGGGAQGALTRGDLCQDMNFNNLDSAVRSGAAENNANFRSVDNAVCTLGYQTAQLASGLQMQVASGFSNLDTELCQVTNNITQSINGVSNQLSQCCCDIREGIQGVNYNLATQANGLSRDIERGISQTNFNMAQQNCATLQAIDKVGDRVIDYLNNQNMQNLRDENFALKLAASQERQNNYLVSELGQKCPIPAYLTCNPNAPLNYSVNYGNDCGCGCNGGYR